jgi:manganese transport protein
MHKPKLWSAKSPSLPEVHASVATSHVSMWRRMFAFAGPAYLVSVGYMDPGNWATDLEGGAKFGYTLLWVLVMSNLMAILLQTLSARLGIVTSRDLAQACREEYPRPISYTLWILTEIAIAACDLAEVLGAAIGLQLLFGIPLLTGVLLTALDTLLVLWLTRFGIRIVEAFILALIAVMAACFVVEIFLAKPSLAPIIAGLVPHLNSKNLYITIGIVGATVMPHNLYLHSALVQTRRIGVSTQDKRSACGYNLADSVIALNGAMFVNAAILIMAGAVFFTRGLVVTEIQQAQLLLTPLLGTTAAAVLFSIALLCSGQSSTLTGTMAGQIVMEGFVNIRMRPWLRRFVTRSMAIIPAAITVYISGDQGSYKLLILSQVILSMQLPFAIIPLIHFTGDRKRMGEFANRPWVQALSWITAAIIVVLNVRLVFQTVGDWLEAAGRYRMLVSAIVFPIIAALFLLLLWITVEPWMPRWIRRFGRAPELPSAAPIEIKREVYKTILVTLDHTALDRQAVTRAAALALQHDARLYLLHVEEGVTSQVFGPMASTAEVQAGQQYLDGIVQSLAGQGVKVERVIFHSKSPRDEIVNFARKLHPDLLVMGAHGHKGLKDLIYGTTIDAVRHEVNVPMLIVRD